MRPQREREREREREKKKLAAVRGGALRLESGQARHARMRMRSRTRHSCGGQTWARESQGGRWVLLAVRALAHLADNPVLSVGGPPAFPHPSISFAIRGRGSVGLLGGPRLFVFPLFRSLCVSSVQVSLCFLSAPSVPRFRSLPLPLCRCFLKMKSLSVPPSLPPSMPDTSVPQSCSTSPDTSALPIPIKAGILLRG